MKPGDIQKGKIAYLKGGKKIRGTKASGGAMSAPAASDKSDKPSDKDKGDKK